MKLRRHILALAMLSSLGPILAQSQPATPPPAGPMRVTTDTLEYCDSLAERVEQARHARSRTTPEVEELAQEGHHMCGAGLIRSGLSRLRRALFLLRVEQ